MDLYSEWKLALSMERLGFYSMDCRVVSRKLSVRLRELLFALLI
jgi:hypothetical protein